MVRRDGAPSAYFKLPRSKGRRTSSRSVSDMASSRRRARGLRRTPTPPMRRRERGLVQQQQGRETTASYSTSMPGGRSVATVRAVSGRIGMTLTPCRSAATPCAQASFCRLFKAHQRSSSGAMTRVFTRYFDDFACSSVADTCYAVTVML